MKTAALIAGASSGIGYELAKLSAQNGHNLVLVARNQRVLQKLADELEERFGVWVTILPTVTVLCPGATRTDFIAKAGMEDVNLFQGQNWPYSSYGAITSSKPSRIQRATVLACLLSLHRQIQESIHVLFGLRCNPQ